MNKRRKIKCELFLLLTNNSTHTAQLRNEPSLKRIVIDFFFLFLKLQRNSGINGLRYGISNAPRDM